MWKVLFFKVHQCYGTELGLTSDDEDYIPPVTEEDKLSVRLSDSFIEVSFSYQLISGFNLFNLHSSNYR